MEGTGSLREPLVVCASQSTSPPHPCPKGLSFPTSRLFSLSSQAFLLSWVWPVCTTGRGMRLGSSFLPSFSSACSFGQGFMPHHSPCQAAPSQALFFPQAPITCPPLSPAGRRDEHGRSSPCFCSLRLPHPLMVPLTPPTPLPRLPSSRSFHNLARTIINACA